MSADSRARGAVLLVSVAILAVLALLAIAFYRLTRLESAAGATHQESVRARLAAEAGVEYALARIRAAAAAGDPAGALGAYALDPAGAARPVDLFGTRVSGVLRYPSADALAAAGVPEGGALLAGGPGNRTWESFAATIRDSQAMIHLNAGRESLARMLENLGQVLDQADPPVRPGEGMRIVAGRDLLPGGRFGNVADLLALPGGIVSQGDFDRLLPYITVDSWIDEKTIRPPDQRARPPLGRPYSPRHNPGHLELEPRAPIHVNAAAKPVLAAAIAGVSGVEEILAVAPGYSYPESAWTGALSEPIDVPAARRIADRIVRYRWMDPTAPGAPSFAGPFRTWGQFEAFLDSHVLRREFLDLTYVAGDVRVAGTAAYFYDTSWRRTALAFPGLSRLPAGSFDVLLGDAQKGLRIRGNRWPLWSNKTARYTQTYWTGRIERLSLEFPEGSYVIEGPGALTGMSYLFPNGGETGTPLSWRANVQRVRFIPREEDFIALTPRQVASLKANFNPNTRLNDFNPDADHRVVIDKADLVCHTTEFCFWPMGAFEIASVGYVHSPAGDLLAREALSVALEVQEIWRETTQADFAAGEIRPAPPGPAPVSGGRTLATYPQPDLPDLAAACVEDGSILLSTYEAPPLGVRRLFRASFARDFDAEEAAGDPRALPDSRSGVASAGDLLDPALGATLYPDGAYSERASTPTYSARGNMGGRRATLAFWAKPAWSVTTASYEVHKFFDATSVLGASTTQSFQIGAWGWSVPLLGFQFEVAPSVEQMNDRFLERILAVEIGGKAGEWILFTAAYDFDAELFDRSIQVIANADPNRIRQGWYTWREDRAAYPAQDITVNDNRFSLGGRPGALIGGENPADATMDEVTFHEGFDALEIARRLFRVGRYYNGGDGRFVSRACPLWPAAASQGAAVTGTWAPPAGCRAGRIAWTARVPASVPGGRIRVRVRAGARESDLLSDPGGSALDLPVAWPVRYEATFEESAAELVQPLLTSMALDDVTVFFWTPPRFSRWDSGLPAASVERLLEPDAEANAPEPGPAPLPPGATPDGGSFIFEGGGGAGRPPSPGAPPWADGGSPGADFPIPGAGTDLGPPPPESGLRGGAGTADRNQPDRSPARTEGPKDTTVQVAIEVVSGKGREPVPLALLDIRQGGAVLFEGVRANRMGRFLFDVVAGESYEATARKEGFLEQTVRFTVEEPSGASESVMTVEIPLQPETRDGE